MKIPQNEIHFYKTNLNLTDDQLNIFENILSKDELQKAYRFKFIKDKNHYIAARGTLRNILSCYLNILPAEIIFSYSDKGKPFINGSIFKFNLSHSGEYAVYVVSKINEMGIDIEYKKEMPDALKIAERYFSEDEVNELKKTDKNKVKEVFFNCWTRKESFIKAIGEGLSYSLKDFSVSVSSTNSPKIVSIRNSEDELKSWSLFNIEIEKDYACSLAVKSRDVVIIYK